jgi:hypothetical protein
MQRKPKANRGAKPAITGVEVVGNATTLTTGGSNNSTEDKRTPCH